MADKIEEILCLTFLSIMIITVGLQILGRYMDFGPLEILGFTGEIARFTYVCFTFVGISWAYKEKENIRVTFFVDLLPSQIRKIMYIFVDIVSLLLLIVFFVFGIQFALSQVGRTTAALRLPVVFIYAFFPIGFFLASIRISISIFKKVKGREEI